MTDLTKKYQNCELPEGVYYVTYPKNDTPEIDIYRRVYSLYDESKIRFTIPSVEKVLKKVPSYEEWQEKLEENKRLKHDVGNLGYKIKNQRHEIDNRLKEIEKLKGLLKELKIYFDKGGKYYIEKRILLEIKQVLGEE